MEKFPNRLLSAFTTEFNQHNCIIGRHSHYILTFLLLPYESCFGNQNEANVHKKRLWLGLA